MTAQATAIATGLRERALAALRAAREDQARREREWRVTTTNLEVAALRDLLARAFGVAGPEVAITADYDACRVEALLDGLGLRIKETEDGPALLVTGPCATCGTYQTWGYAEDLADLGRLIEEWAARSCTAQCRPAVTQP